MNRSEFEKRFQAILKAAKTDTGKVTQARARLEELQQQRDSFQAQITEIEDRLDVFKGNVPQFIAEGREPAKIANEKKSLLDNIDELKIWVDEIDGNLIPAARDNVNAATTGLQNFIKTEVIKLRLEFENTANAKLAEVVDDVSFFISQVSELCNKLKISQPARVQPRLVCQGLEIHSS